MISRIDGSESAFLNISTITFCEPSESLWEKVQAIGHLGIVLSDVQ